MSRGLGRDIEIRDNREFQKIGGLVRTRYGATGKVIDFDLTGCFYVVELDDGRQTPIAFRDAERVE